MIIRRKASSIFDANPYIALVTGVLAVSTGAIFARLADAPALVIAAYRVGFSVLALAPIAVWTAGNEILSLTKYDLWYCSLSGFFLALHFAVWISSLEYTSVANSVVLVNTNPLWVAVLTPFITKERMRRAGTVGIFISIAGAALIGLDDFNAGENALSGDLMAVSGGICMAVYLLLGKRLRRKLSLVAYVTVCYAGAAVFLWIFVILWQLPISGFNSKTWICFGAMAVITQLIGHTSYNWALKWFGTGLIAVSLLGEPIGSTILAYVIFGETLTWVKLIGGILILSAIYISAVGDKDHEKEARAG